MRRDGARWSHDHHTHTTALITGANKGLGAETARRLAALGWTVWLGARDERGRPPGGRRDPRRPAGRRPARRALDVTDDASVAAAYDVVERAGTGLDVLVNNAGIAVQQETLPTTPRDFLPVFGVNLLGPVRVTHAFLPLLERSDRPRLVMVSSGLGTLSTVNDPDRAEYAVPGMTYQSSKAALDMVASQYAKALPAFRVCSVDPGWTATDLNGHSGPQTVTEGTDAIVAAASAETVPGLKFDRHDLVEAVGARS